MTAEAASIPAYVTSAVADPGRPMTDVAADAIRDLVDTLVFAGVKPGMVVGELFPGGDYFTRLLSKVVGPTGKMIGIENAGWKGAVKADNAMRAERCHTNVSVKVKPFGEVNLPEKIDLFWITQNYHDLKIAEYGKVDTAVFNRAAFDALKPGGTYVIIDHEANAGATVADITALHRIQKAQVIDEVEAAGFQLVAEGKFLNTPGDDHTRSIFDKAIQGHTDQYALKFVKPKT